MLTMNRSVCCISLFLKYSTKQRIKCLVQGHNAVPPVMLEPATPGSLYCWNKILLPPFGVCSPDNHPCDTLSSTVQTHFKDFPITFYFNKLPLHLVDRNLCDVHFAG